MKGIVEQRDRRERVRVAGLDKITGQIIADAEMIAADKLDAARKEAEQILEDARNECQAMKKEASEKALEMKKLQESRIESSAEQQRRTALLRAKQELIQEVIEEARQTLKTQSAEEYFVTIKKLIQKYALAEKGEIYFSEADLARMPEGFELAIEEAAKVCGGSLKLMKESRPIEDGFILVYGGIEENCTFKALMDAKKDELQDKVNQILFR